MTLVTLAVCPFQPVSLFTVIQEFYSHSGMDFECFICIPVMVVTDYNFVKGAVVFFLSSFVSLSKTFKFFS
mgnify:CR=1 FL=1